MVEAGNRGLNIHAWFAHAGRISQAASEEQSRRITPSKVGSQGRGQFHRARPTGLVLDLRNDPGGLLYGARAISAAFLAAKTLVVSTDGRNEDTRRKYFAIPEDSFN